MRGSPFVGLVTLAPLTLPLARRGSLVLLIQGPRAEEEPPGRVLIALKSRVETPEAEDVSV